MCIRDRDDIDLVYVATDWKHHAEMGVYAMEHGKHVAIDVYKRQGMRRGGVLLHL